MKGYETGGVAAARARTCLLLAACAALLSACSLFSPAPPELAYHKKIDRDLYALQPWSLSGRVALTGEQDSWSADLDWSHRQEDEQIKLSGPLGQGAVLIRLAGRQVAVTKSDGTVEASDDPERFINQQLGMFVPVAALRYWVLGVPAPNSVAEDAANGFRQDGWEVAYQALQAVGRLQLPRKMSVANDRVKLKLIIDQWTLNDGSAR